MRTDFPARNPRVRPAAVMLVLLFGSPPAIAQEGQTHTYIPERGYQSFAVREPVLRVAPGDTLISESMGAAFMPEEERHLAGEVGPIYIEGAERGDTLVIRVVRLELNRDRAYSGTSTGFAALTMTPQTAMLHEPVPQRRFEWELDLEANTGTLALPASGKDPVTVELSPMLGRMAVAPDRGEVIWNAAPGNFGGNMDTPEIREGVTVYLPVFEPGAYFYFGDVHALQGEGEITGTGLETTAEVTFEFDLIKGKSIAWPRIENDEYIMVAGSVRPLMDAFRIAHTEMILWLEGEYGLDRWEALQLLSQLGKARIGNVVDPHYTVVAMFPKKHLPRCRRRGRHYLRRPRLVEWRLVEPQSRDVGEILLVERPKLRLGDQVRKPRSRCPLRVSGRDRPTGTGPQQRELRPGRRRRRVATGRFFPGPPLLRDDDRLAATRRALRWRAPSARRSPKRPAAGAASVGIPSSVRSRPTCRAES